MVSVSPKQGFWRVLANGTLWSYLATYGSKAIVFISTIVLARILLKEDFGVAGYAIVVISFLNVLHDFGIGTAIIYLDLSESRKSTAFWLNLGIGGLLFGITWMIGPFAGDYFQDERAIAVTRVLGLTFPIAALGNIHDALLRKAILFDKKFIPDVAKALIKTVIAITLALYGMGYWSLIIAQISGVVAWVVLLWFLVPWRPSIQWSMQDATALMGYGSGIATINFLAIILLNVDYLLIGRYFGAVALGIYTIAFRLPELIIQEFPNVIGHVLLPAFAQIKKDQEQLRENILTILRYSAIVTVPIGLGLALVAEPLTHLLFSEKWSEAVPIMQAIAIQMTILTLSFNLGVVYKAQGKNHVLISIILIRMSILLPALWWAIHGPGTLVAIAWVHAGVAVFILAIDLLFAARMLQLPLLSLFKAFTPALVAGSMMLLVGIGLTGLLSSTIAIVNLTLLVSASAAVYVMILYIFEKETFMLATARIRATLPKA